MIENKKNKTILNKFTNLKTWDLKWLISDHKLKAIKTNLNIQKNVIKALIYRELKTRISKVRFGVFGLFIQPLGVITVFLFIFSFLRGIRNDIDTALFLTVGVIFFTLFYEIAIRSLNSMQANEALFFYKPVKPIDTVIARTIVETCLYSIVLIIITAGIFFLKEIWTLDQVFIVTSSYLTLSLFSFNFGLLLMVAGHKYPIIKQIMPLLNRPLWFTSGIFFSINQIPPGIRGFFSWNPILQSIELARNGFTENYIIDPSIISYRYLIWISLFSTCISYWIYTRNEKFLLTR